MTAALAVRVIGRDQGAGLRAGADFPGAVLITGAMMLAVYTIVQPAAQSGWLSGSTLGCAAASLALLAGFVARQRMARHPLMPPRIFTSRAVIAANLIQVLSVAGMFGTFFLGALYLREILGYGPLQIGLAFLPVTIVMGTLSVRYTERLITRFGTARPLLAGLVLIVAGLALFAQAPLAGSYLGQVFPVMLLVGAGAGMCFPALMTLAMSAATPDDAGLASGLVNTTAQVGGALGLAVLATVSAARAKALAAGGGSTAVALADGYQLAFWIAAALAGVAVLVTLPLLRAARPDGVPAGPGRREDGNPEHTAGEAEAGAVLTDAH